MKKRLLFLIAAALLTLSFGSPLRAQCPEEVNDRGNCDTLTVTCLDCEQTPGTGPWQVRFPLLVTHDQTQPDDSIAGFVIPISWTRTNPTKYCSLSLYWNATSALWFYPDFNRSIFRHLVNLSDPTDTLMHNRMGHLGEDFMGGEWDTRIVDLSTDDAFARMSFLATGTQDQEWWEGDRVLLATLTYVVEDTMTMCMDTAFWPPAGNFLFSRADAVTFVPRDNLPHCFRVGPPGPPPGSPVADADPDTQSISVGGTANFDGSNSYDTDGGTIVGYDWDFGDGNTGTGATVSHPYTTENIYLVRLTVTDNDAKAGSDYVTVIVQGDPPVADANGPYTGAQDSPLPFDGGGSTDDFGIVAYEWDFGDGATSTQMMPTHVYSTHGTYLVTLTVYDIMSQADTDTAVATILGPPIADADPDSQEISVGDTANFDASNSHDTDGGTIVSYEWDFGDGSTGSGVTTSHAYSSEGTFEVGLTVKDNDSLSASDSVTVAVLGDPPVADADGPYQASEDVPLTFDGSGSSDDFGIVAYVWDFGDGATSTQMMPTHAYSTHGTYLVTLTVYDIMSQADTDSTTATILGPPVADADPDSQEISPGDTAYFDGSNSHDTNGGTIVSYEWDFGDGSTGSGVTTSHAYSSEGTFEVCLTVMDDDSLTDTNCVTVRVGYPSAAITVYPNDRPGWESAVGVYEEEFFTDATLNPGVSVVSDYPGYVNTTKGVWWDRLVCPDDGLTTTTWQFDTPIISYGGNWNPGVPGGPGAHIAVAINGSWVNIGEIPSAYTGQFWGFVSTEPFSAVRLSPGSNCSPPGGAWCETYEINSMVYSISEPCIEKSFTDTTLFETLLAQEAALTNVQVSGDFNSVLDFTDFEIVRITTGPFAGKGFSKGGCQTTLGGIPYTGNWQGALFLKPQERRIYLKGAISGEISATVEGDLTESVSGSGVYDQYQATWRIGRLGATTTSVTINLTGTLSYQSSSEFPNAELYVLQSNIEGAISGHYSSNLSTVLTHLRVTEETNPYWGEGFSIISYVSESGSGEGWTYDKVVSPGRVGLKGLFNNPLFGIVSGTLDESKLPRTLFLRIERIDLGHPPMADLEVKTWGPTRVSPGQTINHIIEYGNSGVRSAENVVVVAELPHEVEYISCTGGGIYRWETHEVIWKLDTLSPKSKGNLSTTVRTQWGLADGTQLRNIVMIDTKSEEIDKYLKADLGIYNLQEYLDYEPVSIDSIKDLTSEELDAELEDENLNDMFNYSQERGLSYIDVASKIDLNDVSSMIIIPMVSESQDEMEFVVKFSDQTHNASYIIQVNDSTMSVFDREGGFLFDRNTKNISFWGEPHSCTWAQCVNDCIGEKIGRYALEEALSRITERVTDVFFTTYDCAACMSFWTPREMRKKYCKACALDIPGAKEGWEIGRCVDECMVDVSSHGCEFCQDRFRCSNHWYSKYDPQSGTWKRISVLVKFHCDENCLWEPGVIYKECDYCTICRQQGKDQAACQPEPGNAAKSPPATITVARDPNIKYGPEGYVQAGQTLNYEVEFENEGEGIAFGVYITDVLDEDLDDLTLVLGGDGTYNPSTRTITWFVGEVGPGQGGKFNFSVNVIGDAPEGTEIINFATVYFPSVPEITKTNGVVSIIAMLGAICGDVTHDNGNPVANVTVKVIDSENNQVGDPIVTGSDGSFYFDSLLVGTYSVRIVTPLGYSVLPGETQTGIEVTGYPCTEVYFVLTPTITSNDCRTIGYWKHQFDVYLTGLGTAQESSTDLEDYLDLVHLHFNVLGIYIDLENFDFEDAKDVLTVTGGELMEERAKQQLFGLLLNFASGRIGNETVVSDDDRVAAEAVTYAAILINDGDPANDELAKTICDLINNGQMVEAGVIPESPERYKVTVHGGRPTEYTLSQNYPNPFNPVTQISYTLPKDGHVKLQIYNLLGQKVATLVDEYQQTGQKTTNWEAKELSSGIYFYKLSAGDFTATKKMVLTK